MPPYLIRMRLGSFRTGSALAKVTVVHHLIEAMIESGRIYLQENPGAVPPLYRSGVRYRTCESGCDWDRWCDIPEVFRDGFGDCKDLVAWRIAELATEGVGAEPIIHADLDRYGVPLYHVTLRRSDGALEDPSRALGMKG
jgi:hypothetical protein